MKGQVMKTINTSNFAMLGVRGDEIVVLNPSALRVMSREQALVVAAYIMVLIMPEEKEFDAIIEAITNT